jgi:Zn-dependent protease
MLQFRLFGFPIVIHWIFWLNTALMGGALGADSPEAFRSMLAWVLACFVSILIHELGHAFAMRSFGDRSVAIVLYAFGGFARGSRLFTRSQDLQLTAAGPGLQIAFGLAVGWSMTLWRIPSPWLREAADAFTVVSLFWALLNLVPILPLDGGRLCAAFLGRMRPALVISLVCAVLLALSGMQSGLWLDMQNTILQTIDIRAHTRVGGGMFTLIFFGMMAFNNWKQLQGEPQIPWMDAR